MILNLGPILVALASAAGALALAAMGYINRAPGETFNWCKVLGSLITSAVAGISTAITYDYTRPLTTIALMQAVLLGFGLDAARSAVANTYRTLTAALPPKSPPPPGGQP